MSRYPLTVLLAWCLLTTPGSAGVLFGDGNQPKKLQEQRGTAVVGKAMVTGLRWVDRKGRTVEQRLPFPVNLLDDPGFLAPMGEWADLELILEGPLELSLAGGRRVLDLGVLVVPLETPATGGRRVVVELAPPEGLGTEALEGALRDGVLGRVE